jgi:transposase
MKKTKTERHQIPLDRMKKRPFHSKTVMNRRPSPRDLTDAEGSILKPLRPPATPDGRSRTAQRRKIVHAIVSCVRGGCAWRAFPPDVPRWPTGWTHVHHGRLTGAWERIHTT